MWSQGHSTWRRLHQDTEIRDMTQKRRMKRYTASCGLTPALHRWLLIVCVRQRVCTSAGTLAHCSLWRFVESTSRLAVQLYCTLISRTTKTTDGRHESHGSWLRCDVLVPWVLVFVWTFFTHPTIIFLRPSHPRRATEKHNSQHFRQKFHISCHIWLLCGDAGVASTSRWI